MGKTLSFLSLKVRGNDFPAEHQISTTHGQDQANKSLNFSQFRGSSVPWWPSEAL